MLLPSIQLQIWGNIDLWQLYYGGDHGWSLADAEFSVGAHEMGHVLGLTHDAGGIMTDPIENRGWSYTDISANYDNPCS